MTPVATVRKQCRHRRSALGDMRFLVRTIATALRSLRRNAMRSALTMLGIIIGVGSLLAIAEIGNGAWSAIRALLTKTGVDNIVIQAGAASRNGVSLGSGSIKTLTPEDAETILHECPSVDSLAPLVFTRQQAVHGNKNWVPSTFVGTTPAYLRVMEWEDLDQGEPFTEQDVNDVAMVCLLGETVRASCLRSSLQSARKSTSTTCPCGSWASFHAREPISLARIKTTCSSLPGQRSSFV